MFNQLTQRRLVMKMISFLIAAAFLVGCATVPLALEQRQITFIEKTGVSKDKAFQAARNWLAKTIKDSNSAIKVQDQSSGQIIAKINSDCASFKEPLASGSN